MDRRFFAWLLLTTALFFLYLSMRPKVAPPPDADTNQMAGEAAGADSDDPLLHPRKADVEGQPPGDAEPAGGEQPRDQQRLDFPDRRVTLGSMDPEKGYRLLVTLTSQGAGIERVELVEQTKPGKFRFRALEHVGGYLGHMALRPSPKSGGLEIRAVPDGSPVARAKSSSASGGIRVGDILRAVGKTPVNNLTEYREALKKIDPGEVVELTVQRPSGDQAAPPREIIFKTTACEAPLDVIRMHPRPTEQVLGNFQLPCLRATLASIEATRIPPGQLALPALEPMLTANWEIRPLEVEGGAGVEFRLPLQPLLAQTGRPPRLEMIRRFRLFPAGDGRDGYELLTETEVVNNNEREVTLAIRQEGLSGLTLEGWWYSVKISPHMFSGAGQRDVIYNSQLDGHRLVTTRNIVNRAREFPSQPHLILFSENEPAEARRLHYIGLDSPYFTATILPFSPDDQPWIQDLRQGGAMVLANVALMNKAQYQAANTGFWFDSQEEVIPAGQSLKKQYRVFMGPKDAEVLAAHGLDRAIEYGWFPLIAKPLSAILHFFYRIVGNYGLAIIMLTVLVRGCMFPLGRKAALNAQKMQELQPELKRINEMYKDNMEKRAKAMQELYKKHNFKPLSGCLPMFIQLPIFIGLYRCLSVDISLRQAPLIPGVDWCSNLAGPDMLLDWSGWMPEFIAGRGTGWLGPYFNVLPVVTVALFLVQQRILMPKATDEQTRMTQNMMQIMTIFMGILFFKVPSGLCIYFITSSMWSLVERQLVKRSLASGTSQPTDATTKAADKRPPEKTSQRARRSNPAPENENSRSKLQELKELLEKPAVRSGTQRNPNKKKPPQGSRNRKRRK